MESEKGYNFQFYGNQGKDYSPLSCKYLSRINKTM